MARAEEAVAKNCISERMRQELMLILGLASVELLRDEDMKSGPPQIIGDATIAASRLEIRAHAGCCQHGQVNSPEGVCIFCQGRVAEALFRVFLYIICRTTIYELKLFRKSEFNRSAHFLPDG